MWCSFKQIQNSKICGTHFLKVSKPYNLVEIVHIMQYEVNILFLLGG